MGENEGQDISGQEAQGQEEVSVQPEESSEGTGINPAWSELLDNLPSSLHSQVTPHLTKWDQNFQSKINEVHSQYEPYKPFRENNVQPEQINYALGVLRAIEERPEEVLKALQAYMGNGEEEQGQVEDNNGPEQPEWLNHPEYQRMSEMVNTMAQLLVQQRQGETEAQQDSELDRELTEAKNELGDFDEEWVLTKMLNNPDLSAKQAVEAYREFEQGILAKNQRPGPPVLGGGGSVPNPDYNPSKLDSKGKKSVVAQMLAQAAQQNQ